MRRRIEMRSTRRQRQGVEPLEGRLLMAAYFLSPQGTDGAPGTLESPWRTLDYAVGQVAAGDEIVLRSGTYAGGASLKTPNVTIRSHEGERGTIAAPMDNVAISWALRFDTDSRGSSLRGVEVVGGYYYGIKLEGTWDWANRYASNITIEDCVLHGSGRDVIK